MIGNSGVTFCKNNSTDKRNPWKTFLDWWLYKNSNGSEPKKHLSVPAVCSLLYLFIEAQHYTVCKSHNEQRKILNLMHKTEELSWMQNLEYTCLLKTSNSFLGIYRGPSVRGSALEDHERNQILSVKSRISWDHDSHRSPYGRKNGWARYQQTFLVFPYKNSKETEVW